MPRHPADPLYQHIDAAKASVDRLTPSSYDPTNDLVLHNAQVWVREATDYFAESVGVDEALRGVGIAFRQVESWYAGRLPMLDFSDVQHGLREALETLEAAFTEAGGSDLAKAMGLTW